MKDECVRQFLQKLCLDTFHVEDVLDPSKGPVLVERIFELAGYPPPNRSVVVAELTSNQGKKDPTKYAHRGALDWEDLFVVDAALAKVRRREASHPSREGAAAHAAARLRRLARVGRGCGDARSAGADGCGTRASGAGRDAADAARDRGRVQGECAAAPPGSRPALTRAGGGGVRAGAGGTAARP